MLCHLYIDSLYQDVFPVLSTSLKSIIPWNYLEEYAWGHHHLPLKPFCFEALLAKELIFKLFILIYHLIYRFQPFYLTHFTVLLSYRMAKLHFFLSFALRRNRIVNFIIYGALGFALADHLCFSFIIPKH